MVCLIWNHPHDNQTAVAEKKQWNNTYAIAKLENHVCFNNPETVLPNL